MVTVRPAGRPPRLLGRERVNHRGGVRHRRLGHRLANRGKTGLVVERLAQAVLFDTEDKREGTSAFLEKREPHFRGE